eukprot:TRINITY_DN13389_c1_g2_i1.p1 TRINITY_DN13389_c1_g2~~TRINITY_DN13389_c1_g2_i1.p1  ORF type:complete len:491 (+),score=34.39 TRINITY_DN13389_c1_g2_i1:40-1512(+)
MWSTPKRVEIKNSRLASVANIGYALVLIYIVFFEMLYRGSHLDVVPVEGAHQKHFKHPTKNNCGFTLPGCLENFSWRQDKPYCRESTLDYAFKKKRCEMWTSVEAEEDDGAGVVLTSRARLFNVSKICNDVDNEAACRRAETWDYKLLKDVYAMDVERFIMWLEHGMRSPRAGLIARSTDLNGRYWSCKPEPCQYRELLPLPAGWNSPDVKKTPPKSSAPSSTIDSTATASLLELKASAKEAKATIVRSEASATRSHSFMAKSRFRSRRFASRRAASSMHGDGTLKTADSAHGESFVISHPYIKEEGEIVFFPMEYILDIAKIDLDAGYKGATHREFGVMITITITYRNDQVDTYDFVGLRLWPWTEPLRTKLPWEPVGSSRARYDINVSANDQGYQLWDRFNHGDDAFKVWAKNGIYIDVVQSGGMLIWSWSKFAVYISTTLGLISMAFHLTRFWASRQKPLQNLMVERYVARADSGEYERVCSYDDPT